MILFDCGQTLIVEPQFDRDAANRALLRHASPLPAGYTESDFCTYATDLYRSLTDPLHSQYREMSHTAFLRLLFDSLGMTLDVPYEQADLLYWDTATHDSFATPGAAECLAKLQKSGIRIGIISNMCYARSSLQARLARYLPGIEFELLIVSSDYVVRKPDPRIFTVACRKAALDPQEVWYVGDNPNADVVGAAAVGIHPVLYTGAHMRSYDRLPDVPFDRIDSLAALTALLETA